jgi:hypothetical protein
MKKMAFRLPPPPTSNDPKDPTFRDWFYKVQAFLAQALDLSNVTGILGIGNGGTGTSDTPQNGELLIGNGTDYTLNTLTAGNNIVITNGAGTIEIESTGGGGTLNNVINAPTVIPEDTSYPVIQYLEINDDFQVDGNVLILDGAGTAGGGGSPSDSFSTIAVSGQSNVVADSPTDTLTLVAGTNITITTNPTTDSITINSTGGGSGSVTSVTSANADLTVATTTTTPVITMVQAPALRSATTTVNVSSATAPTAGQVLTATSSTAATWQTPSAGGTFPKVLAYQNVGQSITLGAYRKINFDTELFDTNNNFSTVNSRFTPTVQGYYWVYAKASMSGSGAQTLDLAIYKNGVYFAGIDYKTYNGIQATAHGGLLMEFNGTTDYIEMYLFSTATDTLSTGADTTYVSAFKVS